MKIASRKMTAIPAKRNTVIFQDYAYFVAKRTI